MIGPERTAAEARRAPLSPQSNSPHALWWGIEHIENSKHPIQTGLDEVKLGFPTRPDWQAANHLLNRIKDEKGIDLRSSDNRITARSRLGTGLEYDPEMAS